MEGDFGVEAGVHSRVHPNTFIMGAVVLSAVVGFGVGWIMGQASAGPVVGTGSNHPAESSSATTTPVLGTPAK
jgi:hypothetical protein